MAENSHISWTDHTHNEWIGCTNVSAGCDNCYAETLMDTRYGKVEWGKGKPRLLTSAANRRKPFAWNRKATAEERRFTVFAHSLSDVFDEEVPDEWRDGLFETARNTPNLDWLFLTKRLAKAQRYLRSLPPGTIPQNASWGCSIEDQPTTNQRVPELLKLREIVGDAVLWLSIEPLIGPVDLDQAARKIDGTRTPGWGLDINWVIVGGESGPGARPMHPDWARSLRDQCVAAGVPFHFKQWGEHRPVFAIHDYLDFDEDRSCKTGDFTGFDRCGKKYAGRLLDGREWNEFPRFTS